MTSLEKLAHKRLCLWSNGKADSPVVLCTDLPHFDLDLLCQNSEGNIRDPSVLVEYGPNGWWAAVYYYPDLKGMQAHSKLLYRAAGYIEDECNSADAEWVAIGKGYADQAGDLRMWAAALERKG